MSDVTVLGLGQMGVRLVELLVASGRSVTVWNRTRSRAAPLAADRVAVAATAAAAVAASPLTLLIVSDDAAVADLLDDPALVEALPGRVLVNLGTTGPQAARDFASRIAAAGGRLLDGAIQAAPGQMGQSDTPIFLSGDPAAWASSEPVLRTLAGGSLYLGEAPDAAANLDLATLSFVYGSYAGFLHGARLTEATGGDVARYGELVKTISPSFGEFFEHQAGVIASGDFTISQSPMRISISAVDRIVDTAVELGLNADLPRLMQDWLGAAQAQGLADEEAAALIKVLRNARPDLTASG